MGIFKRYLSVGVLALAAWGLIAGFQNCAATGFTPARSVASLAGPLVSSNSSSGEEQAHILAAQFEAPVMTTYFAQPVVSNVSSIYAYNPTSFLTPGKFWLTQGFATPTPAVSFIGNMSQYTGYSLPSNCSAAQAQIAVSQKPGGPGFEACNGTAGMIINTGTLPALLPSTGTTIQVSVAEYNFPNGALYPWKTGANPALIYSIDVEIPFAYASDTVFAGGAPLSAAYATGNFIVQDMSGRDRNNNPIPGCQFWLTTFLYDHRGASSNTEMYSMDVWGPGGKNGTHVPIVTTAYESMGQLSANQNEWSTSVPGATAYHSSIWTTKNTMAFAITAQNLVNAIRRVTSDPLTAGTFCPGTYVKYSAMSLNPANYQVVHTNYDVEVSYNGAFGGIGTSFSNYNVSATTSLPRPLIRLYNPKSNRFFYATDMGQAKIAVSSGFIPQQVDSGQLSANASDASYLPMTWLYNAKTDMHAYTPYSAEVVKAVATGDWANEGVIGYLPASKTGCSVNLYKGYSPTGGFFYTTSLSEFGGFLKNAGAINEATYCMSP